MEMAELDPLGLIAYQKHGCPHQCFHYKANNKNQVNLLSIQVSECYLRIYTVELSCFCMMLTLVKSKNVKTASFGICPGTLQVLRFNQWQWPPHSCMSATQETLVFLLDLFILWDYFILNSIMSFLAKLRFFQPLSYLFLLIVSWVCRSLHLLDLFIFF